MKYPATQAEVTRTMRKTLAFEIRSRRKVHRFNESLYGHSDAAAAFTRGTIKAMSQLGSVYFPKMEENKS